MKNKIVGADNRWSAEPQRGPDRLTVAAHTSCLKEGNKKSDQQWQ